MEIIKVLKVKGFFQEENNFDFVEEQSWEGKALLYRDLTLEGIVVDRADLEQHDRLISGTIADYNGISMIKFANRGFCPCSFYGASTGKEILGGWTVHDYRRTLKGGRTKIILTEIPLEQADVEKLQTRMEAFKGGMDAFSRGLYDSLISNMPRTVRDFKENLEANKSKIERDIGKPVKRLEF